MDAGGWTNYGIWEMGKRYLGVENVQITRIPAFPGDTLLNGNELNQWQKDWIKDRIDQAETGSDGAPMQIMLNPGGADDNDLWYRQDWSRYALLMKLAKDYVESFGHTVVSITGFNEPDPGYAPATMDDDYHLFEACQNSGYFEGVRFCGGNTLNPDFAYDWYNYCLPVGVNEGNTHQLAGTFDSYASFYQTVKANGHYATNDEVHDIMEAIVGAEYGLQAGIYWGYANLARGEFVKACNGVRLGYAEHRPKWTAAAVYRQTDGKVQAFLGGSERQATTTTYRFISKDRPVYFEGVGPRYDFVKELPGGSGYMTADQYFAERVFNVSWGEDIQPAINGTYKLVNRQSGKVMEVAGDYNEANVYLADPSDLNTQQLTINPLVSKYGNDVSYYHIRPGSSTTRRLDLYNYSLDNGGKISLWDDGGAGNQQWYLEYSEDGWFYIRSRESTYCVQADESGNIVQWEKTGDNSQQWRLLPIDAEVEFDAPSVPENLAATGNACSVKLEWSASPETDVAGYDILRSEAAGGAYNTIARSVNTTAFVDNTTQEGVPYFYTVRAVDHSLNRSGKSAEVSASATGENDLVEYLKFDGDTKDNTANLNHAGAQGGTFVPGRQGTDALSLNGSNDFVQLSEEVANQQEISVVAWVKWAGFSIGQYLFSFSDGADDYMYFSPSISGQMQLAIKNDGVEQKLNASALSANAWVHLVVTLGNDGAAIYLNSLKVAESTDITIRPSDFNPMINYIGVNQSTKKFFEGAVDDFRIYNYQLSATEVQGLYDDLTTDVYDRIMDDTDLSVWPNPVDNILHVTYSEFSKRDYSDLQLLNMNGAVVTNIDIKSSGNTDLDVSGLATGIYLLRLSTSEGVITKKIIVKH